MNKKLIVSSIAMVWLLSVVLFTMILYFQVDTDIQNHTKYTLQMIDGAVSPPANFLYYIAQYLIAQYLIPHPGSTLQQLYVAAVFLLSAAVALKYMITYRFLLSLWVTEVTSSTCRECLVVSFALCLILVMAIPLPLLVGGRYYIGHITPNVWHNSTTIFVAPFCLLLFWISYKQLVVPHRSRLWLISVLVVLILTIKASYLFVFFVTYPLFLMIQYRSGREFWINMGPVLLGAVLLALQYYVIYCLEYTNYGIRNDNRVAIHPFLVWSYYSPSIPLSLLGSLAFPIAYLAFYWRDLGHDRLLQYALAGYLVGVLVMSLFVEEGSRRTHANFFWQAFLSAYMLFMVLVGRLVTQMDRDAVSAGKPLTISAIPLVLSRRNLFILAVFLIHLIAGIIYLVRLFVLRSFY